LVAVALFNSKKSLHPATGISPNNLHLSSFEFSPKNHRKKNKKLAFSTLSTGPAETNGLALLTDRCLVPAVQTRCRWSGTTA
jgi:hypothetical protein